jgi:DNA-binding IscR family transcriptional regulator
MVGFPVSFFVHVARFASVAAIGKGGGLHLGRPAEQITLRDLYLATMEDKRIFVARQDIPSRCRISSNINEFLQRSRRTLRLHC